MNLFWMYGRTHWMGDCPSQGLYLHRTTQHRKMQTHTSVPQVEFEPMIPVFEHSKTVCALDHATFGTG